MIHLDAITAFETYTLPALQAKFGEDNVAYAAEWNIWLRRIVARGYISAKQATAWRLPE